MFDVSWTEMLLILLVAIVVIGPKDLPKVLRTVGQFAAKARAMAREFTDQFYEMERQTPLGDLRRDLQSAAQSITADVNNTIAQASIASPAVAPSDAASTAAAIPADGDAVAAAARAAEPEPAPVAEPAPPEVAPAPGAIAKT